MLIGFQEPTLLPWFAGKIQVSDLWFLVMSFYIAIHKSEFVPIFGRLMRDRKIKWFYLTGLLFLLTNGISVLISYSQPGFIEWVGRAYLLIMSMVMLLFLYQLKSENSNRQIFRIAHIFGISLSLIGIIGWFLSVAGYHNETTQIYLNYPYFGDTHRLKAFTTTPSMYISMITICIVFCFCNYLFYQARKIYLLYLSLFILSALLAFTKSFLFIVAALCVLLLYKYIRKPVWLFMLFITFMFLHVAVTHFIVISNSKAGDPKLTESPYTSNEILLTTNHFSIIGTCYYTFKKTAWHLFAEYPLSGVGLGNYHGEVLKLQEEGLYPKNLPAFDPHSTFLGALAVSGLIGFIGLILLGFSIFYAFIKSNVMKDPLTFSLLLLFGIMIAEGISMDILNFRHYWVLIALILFQCSNLKINETVAE